MKLTEEVKKTAAKKEKLTYTKEQILASKKFCNRREIGRASCRERVYAPV